MIGTLASCSSLRIMRIRSSPLTCGSWMSVITRSGAKLARRVERVAAVGHRLGLMAVRREQVAEQLDVEGIVLDDQDLGQFASSSSLSELL